MASPQLSYQQLDPARGWVTATAQQFFSGDDPGTVTAVYVHGNRVAANEVDDRAMKLYRRLVGGCDAAAPMRYVIWSWPAESIPCRRRIVKDVRVKACRTYLQSYYLGWWLSQIQPDVPVSLLGFSYGGRVILGAAHLLGGGSLAQRTLPAGPHETTIAPRVITWASASQASWLSPGGCFGQALSAMESGLVLFNPLDPALRRYQRVIPDASGPALGLVGVCGATCLGGEASVKLQQVNCAACVGRRHSWDRYIDAPALLQQIRIAALWAPGGVALPGP